MYNTCFVFQALFPKALLGCWLVADCRKFPDLADPDGAKESPDSSEMSTVAVSQDPETARAQSTCPICNEDFDQFFKQEDGRWHYANAILVINSIRGLIN